MTRLASLYQLHEQCYEYRVLNIVQCIINCSNSCAYPSCLLLLHDNTFCGMFVVRMLNFDTLVLARRSVDRMNDHQRTSHGTKDKLSLVQQIHIQTAIAFRVRKTGALHLALMGLMAGMQAGRQNMAGILNLENPLQIKLFGFLLCL